MVSGQSVGAYVGDDENYYLVAYDGDEGIIKHYRVDKMLRISVTTEKREGEEQFLQFNMHRYTRSLFGMYTGEETEVTLEARNEMVGVLIDRFGKDIFVAPIDDYHFRTVVTVAVSNQFLGWIMALGDGVRIVAPESVVERMREEIRRLVKQYPE